MIAYSFDPDTGRLIGPVTCDESPLEPGEYLVPAFATTAEPPESVPAGAEARWDGTHWQVFTYPAPTPEPPPPEPTPEEIRAALAAAVQANLDGLARSWGYDGIASAVTYAGEPAVPRFAAEGAALRAWRSQVWAACYEVLAEVQAETRPIPTEEELLGDLPAAPARPVV
jgi:hypothetical protein